MKSAYNYVNILLQQYSEQMIQTLESGERFSRGRNAE